MGRTVNTYELSVYCNVLWAYVELKGWQHCMTAGAYPTVTHPDGSLMFWAARLPLHLVVAETSHAETLTFQALWGVHA